MGILNNLIVRIKGDSSHLDSTLNKSEASVGSYASKVGEWLKKAFAIGAIVTFAKNVIGASEDLNDKFTAAVAGAKGALHEFFNTMSTGDFSHFFANLTEAYNKAKDLAEAMDMFKDKRAYLEYKVSGQKRESATYESIVRDQTGKYSLETRKEYAAKLKQIELEIQKTSLEIAQETFELQKKGWENINKTAIDKAKEMYESIGSWSSESVNKMSEAFKEVRKQGIMLKEQTTVEAVMGKTGYSRASVELYREYLMLLKKGEEDIIPKLFETYKTFEESTTQAQEKFNGILRITNALLKEQGEIVQSIQRKDGITPVSIPGFKGGSFAPSMTNNLAGPPKMPSGNDVNVTLLKSMGFGTEAANEMTDNWQATWMDAISEVTSFMSDSFIEVFQSIGSGNFDDLGKDLLGGFGRLLSQLGKMLVSLGTTMLLALTLLKVPTIPTAIAAIGAGAAAMAIGGLMMGAASRGASSLSQGSSGGGYASSGYSGSSGMTQPQEIKVIVEGSLRGDEIYWSNRRYEQKLRRST